MLAEGLNTGPIVRVLESCKLKIVGFDRSESRNVVDTTVR